MGFKLHTRAHESGIYARLGKRMMARIEATFQSASDLRNSLLAYMFRRK